MLLKKFRKQKKVSQRDLAELLSLSVRQYQRIEAGESFLRKERIIMLEDFFGTPQRVLLAKTEDDVPQSLKNFLP